MCSSRPAQQTLLILPRWRRLLLAVQARYTEQLSALGFLDTEIAIRYTSTFELNMRTILLPVLDGDGVLRVRMMRPQAKCEGAGRPLCAEDTQPRCLHSLWFKLRQDGAIV